jgi:hypothetical protein
MIYYIVGLKKIQNNKLRETFMFRLKRLCLVVLLLSFVEISEVIAQNCSLSTDLTDSMDELEEDQTDYIADVKDAFTDALDELEDDIDDSTYSSLDDDFDDDRDDFDDDITQVGASFRRVLDYVEECLSIVAREGLDKIGSHGGYIDPLNEEYGKSLYSSTMAFNSVSYSE